MTLPVSSDVIDVDVIVDLVFVRVGRGLALLNFGDVFTPLDDDLRAHLTSKIVRRLSAELN